VESGGGDTRRRSAGFSFFLFLLIFGWEGPVGMYLGFQNESLGSVIAGSIVTIIFWGFIGIDSLRELASQKTCK
jgi:hypothetical protein